MGLDLTKPGEELELYLKSQDVTWYCITLFLCLVRKFSRIVLFMCHVLDQGWANYGPWAACGPLEYIMRPVGAYMLRTYVDVNLVRLEFSLYF